jgi:hypothetical protein
MIFDGYNGGTVEVLNNVIIIRRQGVASLLTQGLKGEKRIPLSSITSVQFKEPGLTTGYIQFGVMGGVEGRGGVFNATTDENTVLFVKKALNEFRQLRDVVESRIGRSGEIAPSNAASKVNFTEELGRLADLRDRGVLTEEEFTEEKARLQRQRDTVEAPLPEASAGSSFRLNAVQAATMSEHTEPPKKSVSRKAGIGCLVVLGIFIALSILGTMVGTETNDSGTAQNVSSNDNSSGSKDTPITTMNEEEDTGRTSLTMSQRNAVRSAEQYLNISGFSRAGLIEQLSSSAGSGYSVRDATAAVDSLNVDWNENAVRSAKQYLEVMGFSCSGLVEQLTSSSGSKYTKAQATYGARQAGAC